MNEVNKHICGHDLLEHIKRKTIRILLVVEQQAIFDIGHAARVCCLETLKSAIVYRECTESISMVC